VSYRRNESDGSAMAVAAVLIALFFAFILAWKMVELVFNAFAAQPGNPWLWTLLATSSCLTGVAILAQGDGVSVVLACASWVALAAVAASVCNAARKSAGNAMNVADVLHTQWWD